MFDSTELKSIKPREVAQAIMMRGAPGWLNETIVEAVWASNARVKGKKCEELGWKAVKGRRDFVASFGEEVAAIAEETRGVTGS